MNRYIFLIHRYLGIVFGVIVTAWCFSGLVMMYVQYPDLNSEDQLSSLELLDLKECCRLPNDFSNIQLDRFRIEMLADHPVIRLIDGPYQYVIDLLNGEYLAEFDENTAQRLATVSAKQLRLTGQPELLGTVDQDQWTIYPSFSFHRPLYHFVMNDDVGTEFYISSTTGELVQLTTTNIRFWNWIGSVPHWLYPTILRQHTTIWLQVIIWLTLASSFLTIVGIYIGLRQYKTRRNGRNSPYHGWAFWHHISGLFFGAFTLSWLISGLLSVNPWGVLEGRNYSAETQRISGGTLNFESVREFLSSLPISNLPGSTVRLEGYLNNNKLSLIIFDSNGIRTRLHPDSLVFDPLSDNHFLKLAPKIRPDVQILRSGWITSGDAYYYDHHNTRHFPVYRINYLDGEKIYLDSITGELIFAVDKERRWFRWLFQGLHRIDFLTLIRTRPVWDILVLSLMTGVTVGVVSGTFLGLRRVFRAIKKLTI
ncbi:MAG: hypothetical protein CMM56_04870 [Rhodospirillaceae bacterium]|nr:hypothetical protein [Rhodospirillaceae bacterium]